MLYTIIVILLVLWFLGFNLSVGGSLIHALLLLAAVVFLYNFLHRRGRWV
ncbi:MAG: lmo0937 family membrane protein [Acidobacteria bacterium]|nr:MAG: lmo0937 family membrane protein [Acidobacteriota bacterium]